MPKISELPSASGANNTDQLPVNQGGTTRRVTLAQVAALIPAGPQGATGATGATGPQGPKGDPGDGAYTQGVKVAASSSETLTTGVPKTLSYGTELWDTDAMWAVGSPTDIVCKTAGKYLVIASVEIQAHGSGDRTLRVRVNGTVVAAQTMRATSAAAALLIVMAELTLAVNDVVTVQALQDSGSDLVTVPWSGFTNVSARRVG